MNRSGREIKHQRFSPLVADVKDDAAAATNAVPPFLEKDQKMGRHSQGCSVPYGLRTHQFIAHIRRIHPLKKDIEMEVENKGKIVVKAANPLSALDEPLYYTHSKTKMYNEIVFLIWDNVMSPNFALMCPWFIVESKKALDRLFDLEF